DDAHRPRRVGLRACDPRYGKERASTRCEMQKLTTRKLHDDASLSVARCSGIVRRLVISNLRRSCYKGNSLSNFIPERTSLMLRKIDWESQIGRRLRLRDLHVFSAVVQHGSMAKAARQLGVSHPAVSEVIADLEHALGVRLLDRSAQGVELTI